MDLGHLKTPGFNKDIRCHVRPYCSKQYGAERGRWRERERERERERDMGGFGCSKWHSVEREGGREGEVGGFGQFNDTMSQYGHSVSCMTILLKTI